ncbi:hypothetical protein [Hydrogenimonas sp.]
MILLFGIVSTVAVVVLLLMLYRYANQGTEAVTAVSLDETRFTTKRGAEPAERRWLKELATRKKPSFAYAVSEMEINLPLKKKPVPKTAYRLILKDLDGYKIFCIRQILEQNGIEYAMFRENRNGVLVVRDLKRRDVDRIVALVREYDVKIEIENYKKD